MSLSLALDVDFSALKLSSCLSRAMLSGSMSFMSINAPAHIFDTSFPGIGEKRMESSIGSSPLVALSAEAAGWIAGSKSPMDSRGIEHIVSGWRQAQMDS